MKDNGAHPGWETKADASSPRPPRRAAWNWAMVAVGLLVVVIFAGLSAPMVLRCKKASGRTLAISNGKQVGLALLEFDRQFGSFPDPDTETAVLDATGLGVESGLAGNSANDYLRQLLFAGLASEEVFYVKTPYTREPDHDIAGLNALAAGELGFGYVMLDQATGQDTSGNPGRPVLATPLLDARMDWVFDPDPLQGRAVVLKVDGSAQALTIRDYDTKAIVGNGKTIEQTGDGTVWGTTVAPVLKAPQKVGR